MKQKLRVLAMFTSTMDLVSTEYFMYISNPLGVKPHQINDLHGNLGRWSAIVFLIILVSLTKNRQTKHCMVNLQVYIYLSMPPGK